MVTEFLVTKKNVPDTQIQDDVRDLRDVHVLRGRIIHDMALLEKIMKQYCRISRTTVIMYGSLKRDFIKKLRSDGYDKKRDFSKFEKALNAINPDRNIWAHGFVFYKKRTNSQVINCINLNKVISIIPPYFDKKWNKPLSVIVSWLKSNNLWKIRGYEIHEVG